MALDDMARLDQWWKRRSPDERDLLIERRHGEFGLDHRRIIMDANEWHPFKPDLPPIVAVWTDQQDRFRLPPILVDYLELKNCERGAGHYDDDDG